MTTVKIKPQNESYESTLTTRLLLLLNHVASSVELITKGWAIWYW